MSAQSPFWLVLLDSWCANREGLTLPFIVGADAIRRGVDVAPEDTRKLFTEICLSHTPEPVICLRPCPDIGVPILAIHPCPGAGIQVMLGDTWGGNDEEKLNNYASDAENLVGAGRFSRINYPKQEWAPFPKDDLEFIASVARSYNVA